MGCDRLLYDLNGRLAGNLTGGMSSHAIGNDNKIQCSIDEYAVFIDGANQARVSAARSGITNWHDY